MLRLVSSPKSKNIQVHEAELSAAERREAHGHPGLTLWFTGLSGSGKSTLAYRVEHLLSERGVFAYVLDGDGVRHGLCRDLGFAPEDRRENIRRVGEVAALFTDAGVVLLTAFISPYRADRAAVRELLGDAFVEVHVAASLEVCEARDPKGLYEKARSGEIPSFTGVSAPYEAPEAPELRVDTGELSIDEAAEAVLAWLRSERGVGGAAS
ncbi:MAG: adenylyl-sulfate kinase [Deltaproteobacteria bacterium]|nr:adenylyl-sulfate kinase [Deltaproteobacteria bacterium]